MAGTIIDSELNTERGQPCPREPVYSDRADKAVRAPHASVRFRLAELSDDHAIRELLRTNPTPGAISLSFEREPNFFSTMGLAGADDQTILAFDLDRLVCMGRCSVRRRYLNGVPKRVGYLADLRLDKSAEGRFDILRRGYKFFHNLQETNPADVYFTNIAADNERSLRLLERGVPGMPRYEFLSNFVTLLIPVGRKRAWTRGPVEITRVSSGSNEQIPQIAQFLNEQSKRYELGAVWSSDDLLGLGHHGLAPSDFQLATDGANVVGCAALWAQRSFKQTVIRGYSRSVLVARPWLNLAAKLFGTPRLPPVGSTLAHAFLSPLAVAECREDILLDLLERALYESATRGLEFLTLGFGEGDWKLNVIRDGFRCREYHTRIYRVIWPKTAPKLSQPARNQITSPEVSLL